MNPVFIGKFDFQLLKAVGEVRQAVTVTPEVPPPPDMSSLNLHGKCLLGWARKFAKLVAQSNQTLNWEK